jgi:hypothetical protein
MTSIETVKFYVHNQTAWVVLPNLVKVIWVDEAGAFSHAFTLVQ